MRPFTLSAPVDQTLDHDIQTATKKLAAKYS
jgi:hypothetical protein